MLEKELEAKVAKAAKARGMVTYKFSCPSQRGVPDRIIVGPKGVLFLELKQKGKKPTKLQVHHIEKINMVGGYARWADNLEDAVDFMDMLR